MKLVTYCSLCGEKSLHIIEKDGMIYLIEENDQPKWAFAVMVSIPEEEQSKYPDGDGGYHTKRYDTDNQTVFSKFYECIEFLNQARQILDNAKQIQS